MGIDREQERIIEQLYKDMYLALCAYAMSALNNQHLAEEAVQDTFRIACGKAESLLASKNPKGWIMNTLKNVIRTMRRSCSRSCRLIISALSIEDLEVPSQNDDIEFNATYSSILGHEDFTLLKKVAVDNYTLLEASEELEISVDACAKRVQRAKSKLKKILEKT